MLGKAEGLTRDGTPSRKWLSLRIRDGGGIFQDVKRAGPDGIKAFYFLMVFLQAKLWGGEERVKLGKCEKKGLCLAIPVDLHAHRVPSTQTTRSWFLSLRRYRGGGLYLEGDLVSGKFHAGAMSRQKDSLV